MIIPISFNKIIIFKDTAQNHKDSILFIYPAKNAVQLEHALYDS